MKYRVRVAGAWYELGPEDVEPIPETVEDEAALLPNPFTWAPPGQRPSGVSITYTKAEDA